MSIQNNDEQDYVCSVKVNLIDERGFAKSEEVTKEVSAFSRASKIAPKNIIGKRVVQMWMDTPYCHKS